MTHDPRPGEPGPLYHDAQDALARRDRAALRLREVAQTGDPTRIRWAYSVLAEWSESELQAVKKRNPE